MHGITAKLPSIRVTIEGKWTKVGGVGEGPAHLGEGTSRLFSGIKMTSEQKASALNEQRPGRPIPRPCQEKEGDMPAILPCPVKPERNPPRPRPGQRRTFRRPPVADLADVPGTRRR